MSYTNLISVLDFLSDTYPTMTLMQLRLFLLVARVGEAPFSYFLQHSNLPRGVLSNQLRTLAGYRHRQGKTSGLIEVTKSDRERIIAISEKGAELVSLIDRLSN